jgi:hypothetical protein
MMIALSTIEAGDCIVLNTGSQTIKENTRRLSRTATLDGGAVITDGGLSEADRTFEFTVKNVPEYIRDALWALFLRESRVHLACPEGVFAGYLQRIRIAGADIAISFMVHENLT